MPYVTERWPGGMLTNFPTIRKAVKKMTTIDKMEKDGILFVNPGAMTKFYDNSYAYVVLHDKKITCKIVTLK